MKQLATGVSAPDFTLQSLNGHLFDLSDAIRDRPVVLIFYKASCPTCQFTFSYLQRIYAESGSSSPFRICAISQDDREETREFVQKFGIQFDVLIDEHPYEVSASYNLEFVPAIFIVGMDGKIQLSDYGFSKATLAEIAGSVELFSPDDGIPAIRPG